MNLQQELDRAIGHGPALPTPEERLAAGRAALRRRRAAVGAGVVAVLVAVAAPFALGVGDDARSPEMTDSPAATPTLGAVDEAWIEDGGFRFDLGGTLSSALTLSSMSAGTASCPAPLHRWPST